LPTFLAGEKLRERLEMLTNQSDSIDIAVAWATAWSGLKEILKAAEQSKAQVRILVGVGGYLTEPAHLTLMAKHADLRIHGQPTGQLFHPKLYIFGNSVSYTCWVGSANCTHRGFHDNVETVAEFIDVDGLARQEFESLWHSENSKIFTDFDLSSYALKRKDLLSKLPKSMADELQLPSMSEDQEKDSDILKAEWNVYADELMRIHPDIGKGFDLNDWLYVLDQRNPFLQRKWADDLSSHDLSIMYGKEPFSPFGRLMPIAQAKFQGATGRQARLAIGSVLQEVVGWKVFQEPLVQKALENLLSIDGCGPSLATRLLVLARPDLFVVVNKKSFQGLAERFCVPGLQNLKPKLYAELLGKIHGEPWCRSQRPDDEQGRRLWNYRTALIDPLVYSETNDTFDG
jgi:hypothetical protein